MELLINLINTSKVELLLENKVETKDALLHAINEEYVEAVEVVLSFVFVFVKLHFKVHLFQKKRV